MVMYELEVDSNKTNLEKVLSFIEDCVSSLDVSIKAKFQLELAIEEIFVNIVSYAYGDKEGKIKIYCDVRENPLKIIIKFIDEGEPFNPLDVANPDVSADIESRNIGGLGLFLVKKNVDDIKYEYLNEKNNLAIEKFLSE